MTAKVNLLPQATQDSSRKAAAQFVALGVVVFVIAALGGVFLWLNGQVRSAEDELASAQDLTAQLRADELALAEFAELEERRDLATDRLRPALAGEVSLAGFLQDVALVMPVDAQLETLVVNIEPFDENVVEVGEFIMTGKTLRSHAPGVERLLLDFDKNANFVRPFLSSSSLDDPEDPDDQVATFSFDGRLSVSSRTERYADGLPEELR